MQSIQQPPNQAEAQALPRKALRCRQTHTHSPELGGVEAGGKVLQKLRLAGHDFGAAVRYPRVLLRCLTTGPATKAAAVGARTQAEACTSGSNVAAARVQQLRMR